jgi:hypothetical protein
MANDVICESSLFLLGSDCPQHQIKGISVHFRVDLQELEKDPATKAQFITDTKAKLATVLGVRPGDIVIMALTPGSTDGHYAALFGSDYMENLGEELAHVFGSDYMGHELHSAFSQLQINASAFDPHWNRDFRIDSQCPKGKKRGGQPYAPPAGWVRFGMNVRGKYGDDKWLGFKNIPGEWCVAYHGTKRPFMKSAMESPLHSGDRNGCGRGIYCSPDPAVAEKYALVAIVDTQTGSKKYKYMFMCRVNPSSIHICTATPCQQAQDPEYTLHMARVRGFWFVNCQNQNYQHIRQYGILIKEVP